MPSTILSDNGVSSGSAGLKTTAASDGALALQTTTAGGTATTAVTIDTSQNVGIGTSSPATQLHLSSATPPNIRLQTDTTTGSLALDFYYTSSANSKGGLAAFLGGGEVRLSAGASGNTYFQSFYTNATERARIDSSGQWYLGTAGANTPSSTRTGTAWGFGSGSNNYWINAVNATGTANHWSFVNGNGEVGKITTSGSATTYATSSDYRLKENVAPMTGALDTVAQLKPCIYTWKVDGSAGQGFIAHELQSVVPDAVVGEKDAVDEDGNPVYQGIDSSFLVATLTAAIQEQQALITALTARITALEA